MGPLGWSFVGFPLAGVAARMVAGDIDTLGAALTGGLVGGVVPGAVQAGIGGIRRGHARALVDRRDPVVGFVAGLGAGAAAVGYHTDTASLVAMGDQRRPRGRREAWSVPMEMRDPHPPGTRHPRPLGGRLGDHGAGDRRCRPAARGLSDCPVRCGQPARRRPARDERGATTGVTGADTAAVVAVAR